MSMHKSRVPAFAAKPRGAHLISWAVYCLLLLLSLGVTSRLSALDTISGYPFSVSAGGDHSLFLRANGTVWASGSNWYGQLGDGSTTNRSTPVQVMSSVTAIAAGGSHSLFLKTDGTAWASGSNSYGQLGNGGIGDGTTSNHSTPIKVMSGVAAIAAGDRHSLFLKTDGTVWAAGANWNGELGDGTTIQRDTPVPVTSSMTAIAAGGSHSLFLGTDFYGTHGTVWASGSNGFGQLGTGSTTNRLTPVPVMDGVAAIAAGGSHSLFLKTDSTAWASGLNSSGQLGTGDTQNYRSPVQVLNVGKVASIAAGDAHSLFLNIRTGGGTVYASGAGLLGDGQTANNLTPVQVMDGVIAIAAGGAHSLLVKRALPNFVWASGSNGAGELGDGTTTDRSTPVQGISLEIRAIFISGNLNFGDVTIGQSATRQLTIANPGTDQVTVTGISYPPGFTGDWNGGDIQPGGILRAITVTVTFTPTAAQGYGGDLVVNSNATDGNNAWSASGVGTVAPTRVIGLSGDVDFGNVTVGQTANRTLTISNTGNSPLTVSRITYPPGFSGNWSGGDIGTGGSQEVTVTFTPIAGRNYNGGIFVYSNATQVNGSYYSRSVSGTGVARNISITAINPNFGNVTVGQSTTRALTISNTGNAPLTVTGISFPTGFSGGWSSGTIAAGGSQLFLATFTPNAAQSYGGNIVVHSDATNSGAILSLSGVGITGIISFSGDLAFGNLTVGQTATRTLTISNIGEAALAVTGISYPPGFVGNWNGGTIAVGGSRAVSVTFIPTAGQSYGGTITVSSSTTDGNNFWSASGNGVTKPTQTITFSPIDDRIYGDSGNTLWLSATSSVGLTPISFTVTDGPATVSGNLISGYFLTITGAGSVSVTASHPGDATYAAASVSRTFTVSKASQTISFPTLVKQWFNAGPLPLAASTSSGLPIEFEVSGPATLSGGSTVILTRTTGTVTITASQVGNANYHAAVPVTRTFEVTLGEPQIIAFTQALPNVVASKAKPRVLVATASSGLPVTFAVSGPANLDSDGSTLTLTGEAGTVTITTTQNGGERAGITYAAAEPIIRSFEVTLGPPTQSQTITFAQPASVTYGVNPITLAATASSGLPVVFQLVSTVPATGVASLGSDNKTLTITSAGKVTVKAVQPGTHPYKSASAVTRILTVNKAPLAVSFDPTTRLVRAPNPVFTPRYAPADFVNGDTAADLAPTRPVGRTTATATSPAGNYPITFAGGLDTNYRFIAGEPSFLTVVGFGGTYEALLTNAQGRPQGMLTLLVPANALTYSGNLSLAAEANPISLKGSLTPAGDLGSAGHSFTRAGTSYLPALNVTFTVSSTGVTGSITRGGIGLGSLSYGARLGAPAAPLGNAAYALATNASTIVGAPAGAGYAAATLTAKTGLLKLTGKLADGTPLTASLSPAPDRSYRLWVNPYNKRLNSYAAGSFTLKPHPDTARFPGLYHVPAAEGRLIWAKAASPAKPLDAAYRAGFGPLDLNLTLDPWLPPSTKPTILNGVSLPAATLAQRLGLAGSPAVLGLDHDAIDGTADDALPAAATLTGNLLAPATPNPTGWKITKLNPATGAFTGSFVLRDQLAPAPAKPVARTITFSGVLRQRPDLASPDDPLIGAGHFLVAPAGGAAVTEKTSGAILLLAP